MTAIDWHKLKQDAADTIQGIDIDRMTKDSFILLGASYAILDHEESGEVNIPVPHEKPVQAIMANHMTKSLREIVEDELSDAEMYAVMNEYDIARDELRHADRFLAVLRAQGDKHDLQSLLERRNIIAARL